MPPAGISNFPNHLELLHIFNMLDDEEYWSVTCALWVSTEMKDMSVLEVINEIRDVCCKIQVKVSFEIEDGVLYATKNPVRKSPL